MTDIDLTAAVLKALRAELNASARRTFCIVDNNTLSLVVGLLERYAPKEKA